MRPVAQSREREAPRLLLSQTLGLIHLFSSSLTASAHFLLSGDFNSFKRGFTKGK